MRDFAKISPHFWTGKTGRKIRAAGLEAQLLALYVMTAPSSTMLGLYYLPIPTICHETGLTLEGALKGLRSLFEGGFCRYDEESECVWVMEMARYQVGEQLDPKDNRVKGIERELASVAKSPFVREFYEKYAGRYHLTIPKGLQSPFEGPSKPLRSKETETETETETEIPQAPKGGKGRSAGKATGQDTWLTAPASVWRDAYGGEFPFRKAARLLKPVVDAVGESEMVRRLRAYTSTTPAPYASLAKFAETHGSYAANPRQTSADNGGPSELEKLRAREQEIASGRQNGAA